MPGVDPTLDPATALEIIAGERVTVLEGDASMCAALLEAAQHNDQDFSNLRVCVSAGGSLPADLLRRFQDRFGCVFVTQER